MTKAVTVYSELTLFDVPVYINGQYLVDGQDKTVRFTVRVSDKTLGDVLSYILTQVGGPPLQLDAPWNAIEKVRLDSFAFEIEISNGQTRYGLTYSDIGLDLTFLQIDKLGVFYKPRSKEQINPALDVSVFGSFLGVDFSKQPISWDALKEQPPATPASSEKTFKLEYLGLGQHVSLRDIKQLDTISKVIDALRKSYQPLAGDVVDPLKQLPSLTYDDSAAWLVGTKFSVMETFDLSAVWNLPALAGARIGLRGERAKSLAGLEFEILYRRIAEDLGQYHTELVLPDVLRRFQAGVASVTLPIIAVDIYTDGGFLIDLGFPKDLDFTRSFSIEMIITGIPVTGSIGIYFGVLSPKAVPQIPEVVGGEFRPVIVAGAGFRIGAGKSLEAGILKAGFFVGIEGLLEGSLGFYEPFEETQAKGTFYLVSGKLQLTGHIYGHVNFVIIKAEVDVYAYISVQADFEAYRATLVIFKAGVILKLSVKVGFGIFSFKVSLSFSAEIRSDITIGQDTQTPWRITNANSGTMLDRIGPVAYRRLPDGHIILDKHFTALLNHTGELPAREFAPISGEERPKFAVHFHPISTIGQVGDCPGGTITADKGQVNLVATLMTRLSREDNESLSPAEVFAASTLRWGLAEMTHCIRQFGAEWDDSRVSLSHLRFIADDLASQNPTIPIGMSALNAFFAEFIELELSGTEKIKKSDELTPFPMIPFLSLTTGRDADDDDVEPYSWNFETEPMCSSQYQKNLAAYFEQINNQNSQENPNDIVPLELSMAGLIFVDMFKMVLSGTVNESIELLRRYNYKADGQSLAQIAAATGLDSPGAYERLITANIENKSFYKPGSLVFIAQNAFVLDGQSTISDIAKSWKAPYLTALNSLAYQRVLRTDDTVKITGAKLLLKAGDTRERILKTYGISSWEEVEEANPHFDWSVPEEVKSSPFPYPTLELPAGSEINLPPILHEIKSHDTIGSLANELRIDTIELSEGGKLPLKEVGVAFQNISVLTQEGETLSGLANRIGGGNISTDVGWIGAVDNPHIFAPGVTISIPQSTHIIARGDTLASIAQRYQLSQEQITEANKEALWKFIPRPNSEEKLPEGVEITLPENPAYRVSEGQTFVSIARLFNFEDHKALIVPNVRSMKLPGLVEITLGDFFQKVDDEGESPLYIARRFALDPAKLIEASPVVPYGPGNGSQLDTVIVPDCEYIDKDLLFKDLSIGGSDSPLSAVVKSLGRFLMAGLRMPAPGGALETCQGDADEPVFPLYTLTGQQWLAPADVSTKDWVELSWNDSEQAQHFCSMNVKDTRPVRINLTDEDITIIGGFTAAIADVPAIQPPIISQALVPAVQQIANQIALGAATDWAIPTPISFLAPSDDGKGLQTRLYSIPRNLAEMMPKPGEFVQELELWENLHDPMLDQEIKRRLDNAGWATRLDIDITPISRDGDAEDRLKQVYEVNSAPAQTQADIAGLRQYLSQNEQAVLDLYLAYPGDDLTALSGSLMSGAITSEDRSLVTLLKTNLSTISSPSFTALDAPDPHLASAKMTQGPEFVELLWQISIANGGGFFLEYALDGGLPEHLFEGSKGARVSLIAIVRPSNESTASIPAHRFHNIAITAQTLSAPNVLLNVAAKRFAVQPDATTPDVSEALGAIAKRFNLNVEILGLLNATTPNLLIVGSSVDAPNTRHKPSTYTVRPGDTLLDVALILGLDAQALSFSIKDITGLLALDAEIFVYENWVNSRNIVASDKAGFRLLRTIPVEPTPPSWVNKIDGDILYRIQTLFNMMGYGLAKNETFEASHQGLPIVPLDPEDNSERKFSLPQGAAQPWIYERLLPIAQFAEPGRFSQLPVVDPYAGLGSQANIAFAFQDVFGNRLPSDKDQNIPWQQLYRDPLVPLHSWPSVTLAYDIKHPPQMHAPQMETRVKFAPAGYMASIGLLYDALIGQARADQERYALAYYQYVDQRVKAFIQISLRPGYQEVVETDALAGFAKATYEYLDSICKLEPLKIVIAHQDTFANLANLYGLDAFDLAQHWRELPKLLANDAKVAIAISQTVLPNLSINEIVAQLEDPITPEEFGDMNSDALLTEGLILTVGNDEVTTGPDDTLNTLSKGGYTPGEIAKENADVRSIFSEGITIELGVCDVSVLEDESLQNLAHRFEQRLKRIIVLNVDRKILRPERTVEIPLHVAIPTGLPNTATVEVGQSIEEFVTSHDGSIRDVLSANCSSTGLLREGQTMYYPKPDYPNETKKDIHEKVGTNDTLATIALRFAKQLDDGSIQGADVGAYERNAQNHKLLTSKALALLPPVRIVVQLSVPKYNTRDIVVTELTASFHLERSAPDLIDPAFANSYEVERTLSVIPARLSSNYSREDRATLLAFARKFQKVFDNLKLGIGADRLESAKIKQLDNNAQNEPSKLLVVQWDKNGIEAQVRGPAYFFAPRPLLNHLWSANDVPIYPYVPGQPLRPDPEHEPPAYQLTNFSSEDLERWAETLLARIDRVLLPDFAPQLRRLDAQTYQELIDAKYAIAQAVAARVDLILEPNSARHDPQPDAASAQEQLRQQLLIDLSATYRGGVVVQYDVNATAPKDKWTPSQAPRLLCGMAPEQAVIEGEEPTLDSLAAQFGASTLLIAKILQNLQNILQVGKQIPVGSEPKIKETDSLSTLAQRAGLSLKELVKGLHNSTDYLVPGASIPLCVRSYETAMDDTFGSVLAHLAPNLTSRGLINYAIEILDGTSGDTSGVFCEGIVLKVEKGGKTHKTTSEDTIRSVAKALGLEVTAFVNDFWLEAPLIEPSAKFEFLALYPASTISSAKIAIFEDDEIPNKMNSVFVTSAPDEASSVSLGLGYRLQAMEYNVQKDEIGGYQASEWLTFVDWDHGQDLGKIEIPIPNRRFPLPPTVLGHEAKPQLKDGSINPDDDIARIFDYDYVLDFAFDAASQDAIFYTQEFNVENASIEPQDTGRQELAGLLAQYQSIDEALFTDISLVATFEDTPPSPEVSAIVKNAFQIFAGLAKEVGEAWALWQPEETLLSSKRRFRLRRHGHPDGRTALSVTSAGNGVTDSKLPLARLKGRPNRHIKACGLNHSLQEAVTNTGEPIPRTRRGDHYQVVDPDLTLLVEQNCWGKISITRNAELVNRRNTNNAFILHIDNVRAIQPLTPAFVITQRLDVAKELGKFNARLKRLIEQLLFESSRSTLPEQQMMSLSIAFARPLSETEPADTAEPADFTTLFAPVVTTPGLNVKNKKESGIVDPGALADEITNYLSQYLKDRALARDKSWALRLKLFSSLKGQVSPALLLEVLDLRTRMSDR